MRNIWRIIKADARSLFTHFFALAVALAIAVLPSLYAWLNIYSNWDPYGNTGNISIAVASLDKGWTEEDGAQVNKGREVVEDLRSSTSINWVIVDTKEEAQRGVYAGDYYAAVVIGEDFSYNMYHMLTEWTGKPTITYYENYKKNAVATKITDTAVSSLKTTISKSYLDVVVDAIFRGANDLSQQLSQEDPVGSVQGLLGQTRSLLRSCAKTIDAFQAAGQDNSSYRQDLSDLVSNINQNRPDGQEILDTVAQLNRKVHAALDKAQTALDKAFDAAEKFLNGIDVDAQLPEIQENLRDAAQTMGDMGDRLMAWAKSVAVEAGPVGAVGQVVSNTEAFAVLQKNIINLPLPGLIKVAAITTIIAGITGSASGGLTIALAAQLEKLADTLLTPVFDDVVNDVKNVLDQSEDLLQGFHGTAADTRDLLAAASAAAGTLDGLMSQGRTAMGQAIDKLGSLLGGLEDSDSPDYLDTLLDILGGNPEDYGAYFSQMVQTSVEPVYPIDNYGSAMAPFYSVLAIWVGGVMLVAILKPHARREGLVAPKPYQLFFGRYFLFFVLSQIQAAVIVAGDLLVLKIQCVEPALLFATGAITSLVFSLLIYSLTISFGDVGKAVVVVVMVLQIAGSSGTFPIELLPDVYQKIYHIFPFPYAIDAMRECICGLYGLTWLKNIGCLLIFGAAALLIGLWVRKPFMGLNHFMEEKLEETEML